MGAFFGSLRFSPLQLVAGGAAGIGTGQVLALTRGHRYELRSSALVYVRASGNGTCLPSDLQVVPEAPLTFTADVDAITIAAGTASAYVWLREQRVDDNGKPLPTGEAAGAAGGCA